MIYSFNVAIGSFKIIKINLKKTHERQIIIGVIFCYGHPTLTTKKVTVMAVHRIGFWHVNGRLKGRKN